MDYTKQALLEQAFEEYLQALMSLDTQAMESLWLQSPKDEMVSLLGRKGKAKEILDEFAAAIEKEGFEAFRIVSSQMEIVQESETQALVYGAYEILSAKEGKARLYSIKETQIYVWNGSQWKLTYIHQSLPVDACSAQDQELQKKRLEKMIGLLHGDTQRLGARNERDLQAIWRETLEKASGLEPGEDYYVTEALYLGDERKKQPVTLPSMLMEDGQKLALTDRPVQTLAAGAVLTFLPKGQFYDPSLSPFAGLNWQKRLQKAWEEGGSPVCMEISGLHAAGAVIWMPVCYGLFTPAKEKAFASQVKEAFALLQDMQVPSLVITSQWRTLLHVPAQKGMEILMEEARKAAEDPDSSIKEIVFISQKSDIKKAWSA